MNPKSSHLSLAAALMSGAFLAPEAQAVISITTTSYTENFNTLGTTATASLPTGWKMTAAGDTTVSWADAANLTATTQAASTGSPTAGGRYNWGNSGATTDRAIGFMTSGSYAEPNSILAAFTNNTGNTITSFTFGFDLERYRINSNALTNNLYFSTDGSTWGTAANTFTWGTGTSTYDFTPTTGEGSVQARSGTISSLSLLNGSSFYLRWEFDATASGNSQGIGLDNISLDFTTAAAGTGLYWLGDDTTRGGSGTWENTGGTAWSTTDADGSGTAWDSSKTAIFNTAAAAVTVSGTVTTTKGITFATGSSGSTLGGGDAIALDGAAIADNTITTDTGVSATIGTNMTGSTGMTKAGGGTLVLTGAKDYTGGTTISAGTLQLGDGTTNASLLGAITNSATLAVNSGSAQTLSNDISGVGSLTKSGAGNVTLSGTNSYNGGTTVSAGTLTGTTTSLQGAITNNAAVTFDQAGSGTYAGNMGGSGSLTKSGAGNVTLSGTNSYNGGTTVSAGTLTGTTTSLQGAITNNAAVTFDQAGSGTYAGNMTGNGSLAKSGAGNVTLSGTNSYSGGTTVSAGTLTGTTTSLQGAITNNAAVVFNQSTNGTYSGEMSGTGILTKSGAGAVTLSAGNGYVGGTTLAGGTLIGTHNTSFGTGDITVTGGSLLAGATVTIGNSLVVNAVSAPQLLITQYYEGPATNKWIEITNIGGSSVDLATGDFRVGHYNNASAEGYKTSVAPSFSMTLSGSLDAGQSLLLGNSGNANPGYALSYTPRINDGSVINFNGNDSIVLYTGSTFASSNIVDAIGFTNSGNEGPDTSFVRATTAPGYNLTAGSDVLDFASVWNQVTLETVDGAAAGTDNRLGYSSLTSGASGSATLGSTITSGTATFSGGVTLDSSVQLTSANGGTVEFTGIIANGANGAKGVTKIGDGVVVLGGSNTYTGSTVIDAGVLEVEGSTSATSLVTVNSGAKLAGGGGTIGGNTTIASGGKYSAGSNGAVGSQTFSGNLTLGSGSIFEWDLASGSTSSGFDQVSVGGTLTGSGEFRVVSDLAFSGAFWETTQTWSTIFGGAGTLTGWSTPTVATIYGSNGSLRDVASLGSFTIDGTSLTWTAVPEPTSALAGILLGAGLLRRRRRAA